MKFFKEVKWSKNDPEDTVLLIVCGIVLLVFALGIFFFCRSCGKIEKPANQSQSQPSLSVSSK
jgi:hypothetical protein